MLKKCLYLTVLLSGLLASCSYNELPPKTDDVSSDYRIPKGEIPDEEEKETVENARLEYEKAISSDDLI